MLQYLANNRMLLQQSTVVTICANCCTLLSFSRGLKTAEYSELKNFKLCHFNLQNEVEESVGKYFKYFRNRCQVEKE